jgi:hypothetical protein
VRAAGSCIRTDTVAAKTRQPSTQQRAVSQFKALTGPRRFRVQDIEGFPMIPGYGQIEWFDGRDLAVYTNRPRLFARMWAIPSMRRHQTGDAAMRALFPLEALDQVARVIKARRKRTLVAEEPPARIQTHTQNDFGAVEPTKHDHRGADRQGEAIRAGQMRPPRRQWPSPRMVTP